MLELASVLWRLYVDEKFVVYVLTTVLFGIS